MTEQENREKAIGEFAKDIFNAKSFVDNPFIDNRKGNDRYWSIAEELTAKGYRKADEVRKETAKEILSVWKQIATSYDSGKTQEKAFERIARLAEWYGVEVEG